MPDDPTPEEKAKAEADAKAKADADAKAKDDELGDAGKKALDDERKARRDAEKQLKDIQAKLKEIEDKDKSESEKLAERAAAAEKRAEEADARILRLEVGASKGLTPAQARRLVGTSKEELEADADELIDSFGAADGDGKPPARKPNERLRGGHEPEQEPEPDVDKILAKVPRL